MSREWAPGDVAMVASRTRLSREYVMLRRNDGNWSEPSGWFSDGNVGTARPLVVIDPEDREQVERLRLLYHEGRRTLTGSDPTSDLQAALREFADPKPPRPEEPTGLGAVVEDAQGDLWVRIKVTGEGVQPVDQWRTWWGNRPWSEVDVVRVLSEGVTP